MSKKNRQNLQKLIAKKQQLQQIAQGAIVSFSESTVLEQYEKPAATVLPTAVSQSKTTSDRALGKTAVSIVVIAGLLVAAVIFDNKSPYLNQFGDWMYNALRLQN